MSKDERNYWLAFSAFEEGIGPVRLKSLLDHFQTAENSWKANIKEIIRCGIPIAIAEKFNHFRNKFNLEDYLKQLTQKAVSFITLEDTNYPYLLKQISDPPFVLYIKGSFAEVGQQNFPAASNGTFVKSNVPDSSENLLTSPQNNLAVVGSRKTTSYGREVTEIITADLVNAGFTIVSGMARGIDTVAHKTAISNLGKTIAVLGCGVDYIYPPDNRDLYNKIADGNGCIISEMPLGHWATKGTFPARNRIISGLSQGVLMTEGAFDSGALITCSYAGEQGRDVYAVPGPINSDLSAGTLGLLKKGAKLVTSAQDILEELGMEIKSHKNYNGYKDYKNYNLNKEEKKIFELLIQEELTIDDMIRKSGLNAGTVGSVLSLMEIKGYIKSYGGKYKTNFK